MENWELLFSLLASRKVWIPCFYLILVSWLLSFVYEINRFAEGSNWQPCSHAVLAVETPNPFATCRTVTGAKLRALCRSGSNKMRLHRPKRRCIRTCPSTTPIPTFDLISLFSVTSYCNDNQEKKKKKKLSPFLMGLSIIMLLLGVVFMLWERSKNWESLLLLSFYFCRSVLLEILSLAGDVVDDLKSLLLELSFFIYDEDVKFWDKKRKFYLL